MRLLAAALAVAALACGGPTQSSECKSYLGCYSATGGTEGSVLMRDYGASGTCWSTPEMAATCTESCKKALVALNAAYPDAGCK